MSLSNVFITDLSYASPAYKMLQVGGSKMWKFYISKSNQPMFSIDF